MVIKINIVVDLLKVIYFFIDYGKNIFVGDYCLNVILFSGYSILENLDDLFVFVKEG